MVIDDLNVEHIALLPYETDAPLIVDANTVLPLPVALEQLQPVAGDGSQIPELPSGIEHPQFAESYVLDSLKLLDSLAVKESLSIDRAEGPDHSSDTITPGVKRQGGKISLDSVSGV